MKCIKCGSFAINEGNYDRVRGVDSNLCDVHYWMKRATSITELQAQLEAAKKDAERYQCQTIEKDSNGILRFKSNKLVQYLLDFSTPKGCGMNELAREDFSAEDRMQFAQLIGYSLDGYGELSYVTDASYELACRNIPPAIAEGKA